MPRHAGRPAALLPFSTELDTLMLSPKSSCAMRWTKASAFSRLSNTAEKVVGLAMPSITAWVAGRFGRSARKCSIM